jgi:GT2 family glycosyltransferase
MTAIARKPNTAISILNWNGWEDTLECLESVVRLDYPNYLIVVVDNGSSNESVERIKTWAQENLGSGHVIAEYTRETALAGGEPTTERRLDAAPSLSRLVLIRNEENLGFGGGNNVAIHYALTRRAYADYVLVLNNDATLERNCLTVLVDVAMQTKAGTTGAWITEGPGCAGKYAGVTSDVRWLFYPFLSKHGPFPRTCSDYFESQSAHVEAMVLSRALLRALLASRGEYLNEALFMYLDEFELYFRARRLGYSTVIAKRASVRHKGGRSSPGGGIRVTYYQERNRILVANMVLRPALRLLFHFINVPLLLLRLGKQLMRGRTAIAQAMLCGQIDGYRRVEGKWKYHDGGGAAWGGNSRPRDF